MSRLQSVTSAKNPIVHHVREVGAGDHEGEVLVDGNRLVEEALDAGRTIRIAVFTERLLKAKNGHELRRRLEQKADQCIECPDSVLAKMSSLNTPQGVLAVFSKPEWTDEEILGGDSKSALVVAAAGVRDPGNLGAMLRSTEAAFGTGFLALQGGADPFRDKAVRGSAGSVLRLPTRSSVSPEELCELTEKHSLQLVAADHRADRDFLEIDWTKPTVLALGNEGAGLPPVVRDRATLVRIPMAESIESLNVAVATGVMLFEAHRQRRENDR
ncbi:MAG: RNA methyltransferase [Planctomycetota bacterium]